MSLALKGHMNDRSRLRFLKKIFGASDTKKPEIEIVISHNVVNQNKYILKQF